MARAGSFGGSLNPFGTGKGGGFAAYDIASNLAELEVYRVEVAWGNGTATDAEYLAALRKAVEATLPETKDRESANNRLFDAEYRIGRSQAEAGGLDALIAFDQASLAGMSSDNLKYRSVQSNLDSELAQRRSRDYGDLIRRYNDGDLSTEKLVEWVSSTLGSISPDDPDYNNWTGTLSDLNDRVKSEGDQKAYQDYQQGRMKPAEFLAYLAKRQADYSPESPQWDDWANKIEDATKSIQKEELAKQDQAFFDAYQLGKKSDASYLLYLNRRIAGMDPNDPDLATWKQRLTQATFSLAEDKLRFDVEMGKAPASKLIAFYKNYQRTLNPGSAEYRQIARSLKVLGNGGSVGGGGGGGSHARGKATTKTSAPLTKDQKKQQALAAIVDTAEFIGKVISDGMTGAIVNHDAKINPYSKDALTRLKILDGNIARARDALTNGDKTFLYIDPNKGSKLSTIGTAGVQIPATNGIFVDLTRAKIDFNYGRSAKAVAEHDAKNANYYLNQALNGENDLRVNQQTHQSQTNAKAYEAGFEAIDQATKINDPVTAFNYARQIKEAIDRQRLTDPNITDATREKLDALEARLDALDIIPKVDANGQQVGGVIDINGSAFDADGNMTQAGTMPGWHFVLDKTNKGQGPSWGYEFDEKLLPDDEWAADRLEVHTTYGGRLVTGSVKIDQTGANQTAYVKTPEGDEIRLSGVGAQVVSYVDEHGQAVRAYSLDGETWIRSLTGTVPSIQFDIEGLRKGTDPKTGADAYLDGQNNVVFTADGTGAWVPDPTYLETNPTAANWYGLKELEKRRQTLGKVATHKADGTVRQGQFVSGYEEQYLYGAGRSQTGRGPAVSGGVSVGAPGQAMQVVTKSTSGQINLTGSSGWGEDDNGKRGTGTYTHEDSRPYLGTKPPATTKYMGIPSPKAPATTKYMGIPSVQSQLPPNTPERFDGIGLPKAPPLPSLKVTKTGFTLPAPKATLPPVIKPKATPTPKPKAPTTKYTGIPYAPKPKPKPKAKTPTLNPRIVNKAS